MKETVIQFGEGNFLRGFFDYFLHKMNEKGLYIADLVCGDNETTAQNTGKTSLTITSAIRLVLDKAATVDEAVSLLENHDIYSVIDTAHHFIIADVTGKSVVVEWTGNKMYVSESKILTNHYVAESPKKGVFTYENSKVRFEMLEKYGTKIERGKEANNFASVTHLNSIQEEH